MGVAGLWDVLKPAGNVRSLTELAVAEGFLANPNGRRGYRLGIDASIWFFHAEYGKEGENPVLRTLFFRCARLMNTTFLPLFVFDGPKRPDIKRGKKISKVPNKLIPGMQRIVEAFGFEWRTAPGEAEAELAYLNRIGIIDGVLSDDVDNFLFGAVTVIRNPSNNLSGNRSNPALNSQGKDDGIHARVYRLQDIVEHPEVKLTQGGLILIGLLSGGDYDQGGVSRCGMVTAVGLARCGFGDSLLDAAVTMSEEELADFVIAWRHDLRQEIRTNSQKHIGRKQPALANSIPETFPEIDLLLSYVRPITSESMGRESNNLKLTWDKEPDLSKIAGVCELYFEWGYKESIIKRFRTVIWHPIVIRILRRAVVDADARTNDCTPMTPRKNKNGRLPCGTPSKMVAERFSSMKLSSPSKLPDSDDEEDDEERLIVKIHSSRAHTSTDGLLEYRLEIAPKQLVHLSESGIQGLRQAEGPDEWASEEEEEDEDGNGGKKKGKGRVVDPESHHRVWMPACMVELVEPQMVEDFEALQEQKRLKKANKGRKVPVAEKPKKTTTAAKRGSKRQTVAAGSPDPFTDEGTQLQKKAPTAAKRGSKKHSAIADNVDPFIDEETQPSKKATTQGSKKQSATTDSVDPFVDEEMQSGSKTQSSGKPSQPSKKAPTPYVDVNSEDEDNLPLDKGKSKLSTALPSNKSDSTLPSTGTSQPKPKIRDLTKKSAAARQDLKDLKSFFTVTKPSTGAGPLGKKNTSTQLPSDKDLFLDSLSSAERIGSSSLASTSKRQDIPVQPKRAPVSFPVDELSDGEYDISKWNIPAKATSISSPSKRPRREHLISSSGSDIQNKSPRKKVEHRTPRHRSPSPSPRKNITTAKPHDLVIELADSDSGDDFPASILPPLMRARARAETTNTSSARLKTQTKPNIKSHSSEIIDLTI